ncbi:hypothetical protein ACFXHD_00335 [Streptomyces hydrogenans]|uniref:hypothetical protein n=1 Tax=Streptomyces hydrogenans TaxID=1873719 RepID=UPI0036C9B80A
MYTAPQGCQNALETARAQAPGLTRTLVATLAHMAPHAAYLVLRRHPETGHLHLDSLRTVSGCFQHSFDGAAEDLPELTDPALRAAWGAADPQDPQVLLRILRDLDILGTPFVKFPRSLLGPADPFNSLVCLVVNAEAPEPEGFEEEVTVTVALTVTEEVTYEFTSEVQIPSRLVRNGGIRAYLADHEDLWLDDLDPTGGVLSINERNLDEASVVLAA